MRVARWRWVLVSMVVLVAGWLWVANQSRAGQVPPDFTSGMAFMGASFTASTPTNGALPASEVVAILRGERELPEPWLPGRAMGEPVFGILCCGGGGLTEPGIPREVWVVPYWAPLGDNDLGILFDAFSDAYALVDARTGSVFYGVGE